ncbi:MAG TPA: DinB family protein [Terriglobales bacterium]|nr:DinB family protein [Terriglobales bacterium]
MPASFDLAVLLDYVEEETKNWVRFFVQHPAALDVKLDIAHVENTRGLLHHIFAVEHRYAQRLFEEPNTPFEDIPSAPNETLFRIGEQARIRLRQFIESADDSKLARNVTFKTVSFGELTVTFRKCLTHALIHSIRHWAQLATELRRAGYKQHWQHDFVFTKAME